VKKPRTTIDDVVWYHDDLMVDAAGDIFQLRCYVFSGDKRWFWNTFGSDEDWLVGSSKSDAPVKPWRKAALYILDPGQVAKPVEPVQ